MSKTRRELVNKAAEALGVLAAGQTLSAEDYAKIDEGVDGAVAWLRAASIYDLGDVGAIPEAAFKPIAIFVADQVKEDFGLPAIDTADAEQKLRRISRQGPTYETLKAVYY